MNIPDFFRRLQELNRCHPATWPRCPRVTLFFSVALMILFSCWHLHLGPALNLLEQGDQTIQTLTTAYAVKYRQAAALPSLQEQQRRLTTTLATLEEQFPVDEGIANLLDDIGDAAIQHRLQLDSARPGSSETRQGLLERPVSIRLSGNYHDIGRFAAHLAALPRLLILTNMRLAVGERPGTATLDAVVLTYFRQLSDEQAS